MEGHEKWNWAAEQLKFADRVKAATNGRVLIENTDEIVRDNECWTASAKAFWTSGPKAS